MSGMISAASQRRFLHGGAADQASFAALAPVDQVVAAAPAGLLLPAGGRGAGTVGVITRVGCA